MTQSAEEVGPARAGRFRRVLLKLSGEALGEHGAEVLEFERLQLG